MAEETPGAAVFTAAEVDAVADSIVSPTTRKQMLATLAGLSARLVTELSGALHMHAAIEDELLALWAMVRVLSSEPIPEEPGGTEGWNLSPAQVAKGELFCVFGTGANASCVVNFEVSRRPRLASGPRRQRGQAVGLQGRASARAGAHVAFKDSNGDVLCGASSSPCRCMFRARASALRSPVEKRQTEKSASCSQPKLN